MEYPQFISCFYLGIPKSPWHRNGPAGVKRRGWEVSPAGYRLLRQCCVKIWQCLKGFGLFSQWIDSGIMYNSLGFALNPFLKHLDNHDRPASRDLNCGFPEHFFPLHTLESNKRNGGWTWNSTLLVHLDPLGSPWHLPDLTGLNSWHMSWSRACEPSMEWQTIAGVEHGAFHQASHVSRSRKTTHSLGRLW